MRNLPNFITIARLISVPLLVWLITSGRMELAFWLFLIAGVSDAIDGFVAKHWGLVSRLGKILDPVADKALLVSTYVALAIFGSLPGWLAILVVSRDILIIGAFSISALLGHYIEVRPLAISKVNTALQIALAALSLADGAFNPGLETFIRLLAYGVGLTTILSGGFYLARWLQELTDSEKSE